jgi:hypothetical protein
MKVVFLLSTAPKGGKNNVFFHRPTKIVIPSSVFKEADKITLIDEKTPFSCSDANPPPPPPLQESNSRQRGHALVAHERLPNYKSHVIPCLKNHAIHGLR